MSGSEAFLEKGADFLDVDLLDELVDIPDLFDGAGLEDVLISNGLLASRLDGRSLQSMNSFVGASAIGVLAGEEVDVEGAGLFTGPILASPLIR
tara:strand:+ start:818 stop:1099 length:282 start_codon:yes stop_codon:yes gene_type:complete